MILTYISLFIFPYTLKVCESNISNVSVQATNSSQFKTSAKSAKLISIDGKMKVNATFNNIEANYIYSVTLNITYNDGVVLQFPPTEISECANILNVSVGLYIPITTISLQKHLT